MLGHMKLGVAAGGLLAATIACACGSGDLGDDSIVYTPPPPGKYDGGRPIEQLSEREGFSRAAGARVIDPLVPGGTLLCADVERFGQTAELVPRDANAEASATLALAALAERRSPLPSMLRTPELAAYYAPQLGVPAEQPSVVMELRKTATPILLELLVAVQAPASASRPPISIGLVVDDTSSMEPSMQAVRAALSELSRRLDDSTDTIHLTTLSGREAKLLNLAELEALTTSLVADGDESGASIDQALSDAYQAVRHAPGEWKRVVVISDGEHVPDMQTRDMIRQQASGAQGILAVALGVGAPFVRDPVALRALSHEGRGAYLHLRSEADASQLYTRFHELFGVAIDDLRLTLETPWYLEIERAYVSDSMPAGAAEPEYLGPSGRVVFPFRLRACAAEAIVESDTITATLRYVTPGSGSAATPISVTITLEELLLGGSDKLAKTFAVIGYAEALRSLNPARLLAAFNQVHSENVKLQDAQLQEILTLLPQHPGYPH
jgi:hypothetical protein